MIESGSSLFYLLHCSAHDRLNTMTFRSFRNIPHGLHPAHRNGKATENSLPQHIPHGLHQQNRTDAMPQIHAICCELVDSFSDTAKAASALTIFPCSSTVKATYIAIIDSLGRTIDRFLGCESHRKSLLAYASPNPHAGWGLRQCGQSLNRLVMKPHKLRIISFKGFLVKAF